MRRQRPGRPRSCRRARPCRDAASAPLSVARTISSARSRSGIVVIGCQSYSALPHPAAPHFKDPVARHRHHPPQLHVASRAPGADGPAARVPRRPGRRAGAGCRDRRRWQSYLKRSNANIDGAFVTSPGDERRAGRRDARRGGRLPRLQARGTIFGPNMTTINFNLVHSFCRTLSPGDEIVITALDHDANVIRGCCARRITTSS